MNRATGNENEMVQRKDKMFDSLCHLEGSLAVATRSTCLGIIQNTDEASFRAMCTLGKWEM